MRTRNKLRTSTERKGSQQQRGGREVWDIGMGAHAAAMHPVPGMAATPPNAARYCLWSELHPKQRLQAILTIAGAPLARTVLSRPAHPLCAPHPHHARPTAEKSRGGCGGNPSRRHCHHTEVRPALPRSLRPLGAVIAASNSINKCISAVWDSRRRFPYSASEGATCFFFSPLCFAGPPLLHALQMVRTRDIMSCSPLSVRPLLQSRRRRTGGGSGGGAGSWMHPQLATACCATPATLLAMLPLNAWLLLCTQTCTTCPNCCTTEADEVQAIERSQPHSGAPHFVAGL